jgi:hypothetical protein
MEVIKHPEAVSNLFYKILYFIDFLATPSCAYVQRHVWVYADFYHFIFCLIKINSHWICILAKKNQQLVCD